VRKISPPNRDSIPGPSSPYRVAMQSCQLSDKIMLKQHTISLFLISNFRCVLNVVCFLLGNSPAPEFRRRGITQKKAYNISVLICFDFSQPPSRIPISPIKYHFHSSGCCFSRFSGLLFDIYVVFYPACTLWPDTQYILLPRSRCTLSFLLLITLPYYDSLGRYKFG